MITFKEIETTRKVADTYTCDRCEKVILAKNDIFELQEWHFIDFYGGYSSVFGDEAHVRCDICNSCLKELIGDFCRYEDN